jgi:hypothetical protein
LKSEDQMMKNGRSLAVKLKIMNLSFVETHIPILRAVKENRKMHID